jgi:vanillate O-demethylase monooxygenase subunit
MKLPRECTFSESDWNILARCWHVVARSDDVKDKPLAVRLLDERVVLYRTTQGITAARDICLHRGAALSLGWVEVDEIVCAYHGFRYANDGRCTQVPAHPELPIPAKLCLSVFGTQEKFGLVWVQLIPDTTRDLPEFPEWDTPGFQQILIDPLPWNASAGRQVESFSDVAHFAWVHTSTFAASNAYVPKYEATETPTGVHVVFDNAVPNAAKDSAHRGDENEKWRRVYDLTLPFSAHLSVHFPNGSRLGILNVASPVSARQTRVFASLARDFDQDQPVQAFRDFQYQIYGEDQRIVESQHPEDLPVDLAEEVHLRADRTSITYRRALGRMGLGTDFVR